MCGIAGYIGNNKLSTVKINATLELMKNRGPNARRWKTYNFGNQNLYFLHSRLSIIDLDERSHQPFEVGDYSLVYNGEIYNYIEVRQILSSRGHQFFTESDTEVLLKAYIEFGEQCVNYFNGMWSFAIFDKKLNKVFLSRDRFGEKPLYYYQDETGFYFGSEVKFIQQLLDKKISINIDQINRYLVYGYKTLFKTKDTFFEGLKEIKYASNAVIKPDLSFSTYRFWYPKPQPKLMTVNEAIEGTRHHLIESVKLRLRSDVPLAFCLSGGVDSASLASIAAKVFNYDVATFSIIDSDERYNELGNIQATINDLGCKSNLIQLEHQDVLGRLKKLIRYHDAPIPTISYYVHSLLSEKISEQGFKVAISGTSADELFTGYYDHFNLHLYEMRTHPNYDDYLAKWKTYTGNFIRNPYLKKPDLYVNNESFRGHNYLNSDVFSSFLQKEYTMTIPEEKFTDSLLRNRMLNELFHEATPVVLHEDDLNSMYYSIENRSPFLDHHLFNFAYSIPSEHLIRDGYGKFILRESLKGILNEQVRLDRAKKGFNADIHSILDLKDKMIREYLLDDSPVFNLVKKKEIETLINKDSFSNSFKKFFFNFINTKIFLETFG